MKKIVITLKAYKEELVKVEAELLTLPDGNLMKRGKFYCHLINQKQIGITKNKKLQRQLCRRKYLLFRRKQLKQNIAIFEYVLGKLNQMKGKEAINTFTGAYSEMPDDYFFHPSMEKWLVAPDQTKAYRPEDLKYTSNNGVKLRTKSEVFIANQLESYNIFYRYEIKIKLEHGNAFPDFAIINPYTGKVILWEHFGGLHLPEYEKRMNEKMANYLKRGYIPFETIIYTFESDSSNPERLKYLIENIIL